jgi:hypothetical protein
MNKIAVQVGTIVGAVAVFAMLVSVGYFTQIGISQTFGPEPAPDNPREAGNQPYRNRAYRGNAARSGNSAPRDPIPEGESVWEDYALESLDNGERLKDRPGNFEVLTMIGRFFESVYQVEPLFDDVAYPLQQGSGVVASKEEGDAEYERRMRRAREAGRKERNKARSYNFVIHKVTLQDFKHGEDSITNPVSLGVDLRKVDRFIQVRKAHPERCVLAMIRMSWESLQSDKVEFNRSDSDIILCWVKKDDGWKLVWFEK